MIAGSLDFKVPAELEARRPPEARGIARDEVRLLVSDRVTGALEHRSFRELPELLVPGDLLVVNDSATLPAALPAHRDSGAALALHLSARVANSLWIVEPRGEATQGERLELPAGGSAILLAPVDPRAQRLWYARLDVRDPIEEYLHQHGAPIRYTYAEAETSSLSDYQTIFARVPGSAEMPSAGHPFTRRLLDALAKRNVEIAAVTLHAGVSSAETHEPPQAEPFSITRATADAVNTARREQRRVIAVGTTVVRALESAVSGDEVVATERWSDLIVTPERGVHAVDGLLTGFHEPRASHLAMLAAFLSPDALRAAYDAALASGYLWHEFGDMHAIFPSSHRGKATNFPSLDHL